MSDYRRYRVPGGTYFFTVNLLERKPNDLLVRHIDILRRAVMHARQRWPFHIDAWVVLPDHLHCVWTLPEGDSDNANRWRVIKQHFSKSLPLVERRSAIRVASRRTRYLATEILGARARRRCGLRGACRLLSHQSIETWFGREGSRLALFDLSSLC